MTKLKLSAVRLFVRDVERARGFYVDILGLKLVNHMADYGVSVLTDGRLDIVVEEIKSTDPSDEQALVGRFTGISFSVESIADEYQRLLTLGVCFTGKPEKQFWGGQLATFKDIDNNELQLVAGA